MRQLGEVLELPEFSGIYMTDCELRFDEFGAIELRYRVAIPCPCLPTIHFKAREKCCFQSLAAPDISVQGPSCVDTWDSTLFVVQFQNSRISRQNWLQGTKFSWIYVIRS